VTVQYLMDLDVIYHHLLLLKRFSPFSLV